MSDLARRLVLGCLIPAALTPRKEWHDRWKHVNAAAGAIAAQACTISQGVLEGFNGECAERLCLAVEAELETICAHLGETDYWRAGLVWLQRRELIDGLRKRVSERLTLLLCQDVAGVERAMAIIKESRK